METLLISFFAVATAELGDKTQLVALCLATHFRKPVPVTLGILAATILSNVAAGLAGHSLRAVLSGNTLHWLLAFSFFSAAVWAFKPESDEEIKCETGHKSIFMACFVAFFLAEMGDKTQLATVALAAQFSSLAAVVTGTTLGMMVVNVPAVLLSHAIANRIPLALIKAVSGVLFAALGIYELITIWHG